MRAARRLLGAALALAALDAAAAPCAEDRIDFLLDAGTVSFEIELAVTPGEQAQGLMHRPVLPEGTGMLFLYDPPRRARFWMKNTMIPLDMIFIDETGRVESIEARAVPHSLTVRASQGPVTGVLEINGGRAEALGIGPGAQARHPAFPAAPDGAACLAAE